LTADITFNSDGSINTLTAGAGWTKTGNTLTMTGWVPVPLQTPQRFL
jgi:flagellar hook protein FlgE